MKIDKELFEAVSNDSGLDAGSIYAIVRTESNGHFRWRGGKIPILFERHWAYRLYKKKHGVRKADRLARKYPKIINPRAGGYGKFSAQYGKLSKAIKLLGKEIAHQSTSFGAFQIMGFNHKVCGFDSAVEMSDAYHADPQIEQIKGFIEFVKNYRNGKLLKAVKARNWSKVALIYNGKAYRKNSYHTKLEIAYRMYWDS